MSSGIAIRREALAVHENYVRYYERQGRLSFELKCALCEVVYVVYCEPGIKERSAREEFEEKIWNEHPSHGRVIAIGGRSRGLKPPRVPILRTLSFPGAAFIISVSRPLRSSANYSFIKTLQEVMSTSAVILLIDDDPIGIRTRTAVLERNGYRVLIASTAAEGLRVFSEQRVDLVMSDHFLRDKRGTALSAELKRLKPSVPVMIFSGAVEVPEGIEKADAFVTKLETIPVMLGEIARLLRVHGAAKAKPAS